MMYSTRKELADAVIVEYNRAVKGQCKQLYSCKAWILRLTIPILSFYRVIQPLLQLFSVQPVSYGYLIIIATQRQATLQSSGIGFDMNYKPDGAARIR